MNHGTLDSCQCFGQIASCSVYGEAVFISFCPKLFVGCTFLIKLPPLHMWSAPVEKMSDVNKVMRTVTTCRLGLGKALESTKYVLEPVEMELYHSYNMDGDVYIFMLGMVFIFTFFSFSHGRKRYLNQKVKKTLRPHPS